ncbi:hypothetical protein DFH07DRAFT_767389 [Mycena maculata]|uniref:Uncharacterized protein n=1 Tax=Mycena maculata TaxID=230809 RepID=A0AAD7NTS0_9AGAR|nr:hypothetical protein DFH07DRAFT_767389 [Mycena maculata]
MPGPSSLALLARHLAPVHGQSRSSPAPSQLQPQTEAGPSSLVAAPTPATPWPPPAPPVLLPLVIPHTPDRSREPEAELQSPVLYIPPIQEVENDDTDAALLQQYDAGYEDEDKEEDEGENGLDEEDVDTEDLPDRATLLSNEFVDKTIAASKIPDEIVDEISLLLSFVLYRS